ncbi:MAG: glycerol-3-phosphate 1-O-acyltransferase PlsY [Fusicatenibacter sp.]|nr:glycerol-3-phosphate 1-O-acyltransferase PlsY [Fusicatenibacter sp.]
MVRVVCLLIGYVFGLFQTSYIYGRMHGIDIREHGSGNAGTTNALRTLGRKAGLITLAGDCLKCIFAVLVVRLLFGASHPDMIKLLTVYAAAGTILGHNFPFYLGFRGGKGIAATAGLILSFDWRITLICAAVFFTILFTTHYVSLGSILVYVFFLGSTLILGEMGFFPMAEAYRYEMYLVIALLAILAVWEHRGNIKRLLSGTEHKTYLGKKKESEPQKQ